ncbi:curli assembly protein CsgF [Flavobacterium lipolyticum]|uniref:Curli production assembly/transport component CsgF n=1 Tax=Flavobacterium lipolyticum TaxID=2893754 RepID=A0ABS8M4C9_9FLAO|nr:curli assembly protein CsgF [Flavobacterium sp. F-126]MCC9019187.1 curli assembly protein CsgF [Flavobacterium sp. F-126]
MKNLISFVFVLVFCTVSFAQDLAYKPVNPAFSGGETFNYQWLLSSAQAQNDFKEDNTNGYKQPTDLERFKSTLNNQLLNRISNSLFDSQFGSGTGSGGGTGGGTGGGLTPGNYVFGTLSVDIYNSNLGMVVNILDIETGEQTQVIIPGK